MFSIVLPCYNEQDNLDFLFKEIKNFKSKNFQFIILNNDSSDNTGKRINNFEILRFKFSFKKRIVGQSSGNRGFSKQLKISFYYFIYLFNLLFSK